MPVEVRTKSGKKPFESAHLWVRNDEAHLLGKVGQTVPVYPHVYRNEQEPGDSKWPAMPTEWPANDLVAVEP